MLDTNSFDYLFLKQLQSQMIAVSTSGKIKFFITPVQLDELQAFKLKDPPKYRYCQDIIEKVPVEKILVYGIYMGAGHSKRGYSGPKFGDIRFSDGDPIFDQPKEKLTASHPIGDRADLSIIQTAFYEKLDYIASDDNGVFPRMLERLRTERGSNLRCITNSELEIMLRQLTI
jgi:hypothetical protein